MSSQRNRRSTYLGVALASLFSLLLLAFSTGAASASTLSASPAAPASPTTPDRPGNIVDDLPPGTVINEGWRMNDGGSVESTDGGTELVMRQGFLEVWHDNEDHVWTANYNRASYVTFQTDGNLVAYNSSNAATWASNTGEATCGPITCYLDIQNDGNVVIYAHTSPLWYVSVWDTGTVK